MDHQNPRLERDEEPYDLCSAGRNTNAHRKPKLIIINTTCNFVELDTISFRIAIVTHVGSLLPWRGQLYIGKFPTSVYFHSNYYFAIFQSNPFKILKGIIGYH